MHGSHAHKTIPVAGKGDKDQVRPCHRGLSSHALHVDCVLKVTEAAEVF